MILSPRSGFILIVGIPLVLASAMTAPAGADVLIDCVEGNFVYPNLRTTPGTTVTFTPEQIAGPGTAVFWIGSSIEGCTVVETHSTNPPLDSERRVGIAVRILGEDGNVATETVSWGTIKGTFQ